MNEKAARLARNAAAASWWHGGFPEVWQESIENDGGSGVCEYEFEFACECGESWTIVERWMVG